MVSRQLFYIRSIDAEEGAALVLPLPIGVECLVGRNPTVAELAAIGLSTGLVTRIVGLIACRVTVQASCGQTAMVHGEGKPFSFECGITHQSDCSPHIIQPSFRCPRGIRLHAAMIRLLEPLLHAA